MPFALFMPMEEEEEIYFSHTNKKEKTHSNKLSVTNSSKKNQ